MRPPALVPTLACLVIGYSTQTGQAQILGASSGPKANSAKTQSINSSTTAGSLTNPLGNQTGTRNVLNIPIPNASQIPATGGTSAMGQMRSPYYGGYGYSGYQQSMMMDAAYQQQQYALQQMQANAQIQAAQQQQQAAAASARQRAQEEAARQRRLQKVRTEEPEELFAKPELKRLENDTEEAASARQLQLAKSLSRDAEVAQSEGDGALAVRLKSRVAERLSEIAEKYPKTPAGKEARRLFEILNP